MTTAPAEDLIGLVADPRQVNDGELPLMRGVKGLLDPAGILNPGKIFEL